MSKFLPKMYQKDIYSVDYKFLKKKGIKCLLFDLDNTCIPYKIDKPNDKLKRLFYRLKKHGFEVIIFSNSPKKRLEKFKDLEVDYNALSMKPLSRSFKKVLRKYNYNKNEVCLIGDQIFTDVYGGNKIGIYTCLVEPIDDVDMILTNVSRVFEKRLFNKWDKDNVIKKGVYYNEL